MNDLGGRARFLEVSAEPRYWEDAILNGETDSGGMMPLRRGSLWEPVVDLDSGEVLGWPAGQRADVHYKVCDHGSYWLRNSSGERIAKWKGFYVPDDLLCVGGGGFGDYIVLKIGAGGMISGWLRPVIDADKWAPLADDPGS